MNGGIDGGIGNYVKSDGDVYGENGGDVDTVAVNQLNARLMRRGA